MYWSYTWYLSEMEEDELEHIGKRLGIFDFFIMERVEYAAKIAERLLSQNMIAALLGVLDDPCIHMIDKLCAGSDDEGVDPSDSEVDLSALRYLALMGLCFYRNGKYHVPSEVRTEYFSQLSSEDNLLRYRQFLWPLWKIVSGAGMFLPRIGIKTVVSLYQAAVGQSMSLVQVRAFLQALPGLRSNFMMSNDAVVFTRYGVPVYQSKAKYNGREFQPPQLTFGELDDFSVYRYPASEKTYQDLSAFLLEYFRKLFNDEERAQLKTLRVTADIYGELSDGLGCLNWEYLYEDAHMKDEEKQQELRALCVAASQNTRMMKLKGNTPKSALDLMELPAYGTASVPKQKERSLPGFEEYILHHTDADEKTAERLVKAADIFRNEYLGASGKSMEEGAVLLASFAKEWWPQKRKNYKNMDLKDVLDGTALLYEFLYENHRMEYKRAARVRNVVRKLKKELA